MYTRKTQPYDHSSNPSLVHIVPGFPRISTPILHELYTHSHTNTMETAVNLAYGLEKKSYEQKLEGDLVETCKIITGKKC